jgi:hypothetical protein
MVQRNCIRMLPVNPVAARISWEVNSHTIPVGCMKYTSIYWYVHRAPQLN